MTASYPSGRVRLPVVSWVFGDVVRCVAFGGDFAAGCVCSFVCAILILPPRCLRRNPDNGLIHRKCRLASPCVSPAENRRPGNPHARGLHLSVYNTLAAPSRRIDGQCAAFPLAVGVYQSLRWRRMGGAPVSGGDVRNGLCAGLCARVYVRLMWRAHRREAWRRGGRDGFGGEWQRRGRDVGQLHLEVAQVAV